MKPKEYYTSGELAKLFDLPKQTMFYYDKMGLLVPEFVAENGYRYYSMSQYLTLEIILFLRRLDISVPAIKKFLEHRSKEGLLALLDEKESDCRKTITEMEAVIHAIEKYRSRITRVHSLPLDRVLLQNFPECAMYVTPIPPEKRGGFAAIAVRAKHVRDAFADSYCKDRPTGWVIAKDDFFAQRFRHASAVVTKAETRDTANFIREEGLYCSILLKGSYFFRCRDAYEELNSFMRRNSLVPAGDVFLFPIVSYWAVDDPGEYINSLTIKVSAPPPINKIIFSQKRNASLWARFFLCTNVDKFVLAAPGERDVGRKRCRFAAFRILVPYD